MKPFELSGQWYEPNSTLSVGGILTFSAIEGIRLNLKFCRNWRVLTGAQDGV